MSKTVIDLTDMFCGAGGSSSGAHAAGAEIRMAINHWKLAIETHNTNFPYTDHDCTDISASDPRRYPSTRILIASPECTNHSLAKGQKRKNQSQLNLLENGTIDPAAERSRATMWDVVRFSEYHRYDIVIVENVVDVRMWDPFDAWIHAMQLLGYSDEAVYLNSMFSHLDPFTPVSQGDYVPQSRDRVYFIFWRKGIKKPDLAFHPQAECLKCQKQVAAIQSWRDRRRQWGKYRSQYDYRCPTCANVVYPYFFAAANAIDWSLPSQRIGDRKRPLKERTLERIRMGLEKFSNQWIILHTDHGGAKNTHPPRPIDREFPTQPGRDILALAMPSLINLSQNSLDQTRPVSDPSFTQVSSNKFALATPMVLSFEYTHGHNRRATAITDIYPTQKATTTPALIMPMPFLSVQFTPGYNKAIDDTLATVTAQDHHAIVQQAPFVSVFTHEAGTSIGEPLATMTTHEQQALIQSPFVTIFRSNAEAKGIDDALPTFVAGGTHHGLILPQAFTLNYYTRDNAREITGPATAVTASNVAGFVEPQGKATVEDCHFRMLQSHEIQAAMAFPKEYQILGTQKERVKQLGNAVTRPVMQRLLERCMAVL